MSTYAARPGFALYSARNRSGALNMNDHAAALARLGGRASRKLANNTYLLALPGGAVGLKLHATVILTWHADGRVVFNSGGYQTVTTKQRMNAFGPSGVSVWSDKGLWHIKAAAGPVLIFQDGVTLNGDGSITGAAEDNGRKIREQRKRITEYANSYVSALLGGNVPPPSGGDYWICLFPTVEGRPDTEHLLSHLDEKYYVPSLLLNAFRSCGYRDPSFWVSYVWGPRANLGEAKRHAPVFRRVVRRFLMSSFGLVK